jgi:hypothetical protein
MPPFRWEAIDHSLVRLKLADLAEEMRSQIRRDERRIHFENRRNLNDMAGSYQILGMKQQRADEKARRTYEIYCEVLRSQGETKSAAFIRAVSLRVIQRILRSRENAIAGELRSESRRRGSQSQVYNLMLIGHRFTMKKLQETWRRRLEIEAKECEHAEHTNTPSTVALGTTSSADNESNARNPNNAYTPDDKIQRRALIIKKVQNPQVYTILTVDEAALFFEVQPRTIHRWTEENRVKRGPKRGSITIKSIREYQRKRSRKQRKP